MKVQRQMCQQFNFMTHGMEVQPSGPQIKSRFVRLVDINITGHYKPLDKGNEIER